MMTFEQQLVFESLIDSVKTLTRMSLNSSINKEESDFDYLQGQEKRYFFKYEEAKHYINTSGQVKRQPWRDSIVKELENINTIYNQNYTLDQFMGQIVMLYEEGETKRDIFESAIELYRTKTKDLILKNQLERANNAINLAYNIPNDIQYQTDIPNLLIQLDNI